MTKDEALKLALDALETSMYPQQKQLQAITAIKEALMSVPDGAQPSVSVEQEPVAYINVEQRKLELAKYMTWDTPTVVNLPKIPLYITPPPVAEPHKRKPLTDEEIGAILEGVNAYGTRLYTFARAIEAAHGIKGEA